MGGSNPYLRYANQIKKAKTRFQIRFMPMDKTIEVDPEKIPFGETGLPGSVLDIALNNGIEIDHACGGVSACATCHIIVKEGSQTCNEAEDFELDQLEAAPGTTSQSRLSCQCVPDGTKNLVVEIPKWNRNLVSEGSSD